jgi:hypothetical protein
MTSYNINQRFVSLFHHQVENYKKSSYFGLVFSSFFLCFLLKTLRRGLFIEMSFVGFFSFFLFFPSPFKVLFNMWLLSVIMHKISHQLRDPTALVRMSGVGGGWEGRKATRNSNKLKTK